MPGIRNKLRTFQRRVADYKAMYGPPKEVFFAQVHTPGKAAQVDFTHVSKLGVTIQGEPLSRLVFECILCYSGHRFASLARSESYEALSFGLQGAFVAWGGVPAEVVQDHMSAAIHNLKGEGQERYEVNARYKRFVGSLRHAT